MQKINYKVPGGKMLRLKVELDNYVIESIQITGDFFIYPETAITDIENFLQNKDVRSLEKELSSFVNEHKIKLIGFSPKDLQSCLLGFMID